MNFLEQLLNVSPDGGSGTLELLLLAGSMIAVACGCGYGRQIWRTRHSGR